MSFFIAVDALDNGAVGILHSLLRAALGNMTKFIAIATLGQVSRDDITSVSQTSKDLCVVLGPALFLGRAAWLVREAVIDCILLSKVALQVHVGQGDGQTGLDKGNQEKAISLGTKSLLELNKGDGGLGLDVKLDLFFDLVHVLLLDGLFQELPGFLSRDVRKVAAVDSAGIGAVLGEMV